MDMGIKSQVTKVLPVQTLRETVGASLLREDKALSELHLSWYFDSTCCCLAYRISPLTLSL